MPPNNGDDGDNQASRQGSNKPWPLPRPFPPPFITSLTSQGVQASLLLLRKAWAEEEFLKVLDAAGLAAQVGGLKTGERQRLLQQARAKWHTQLETAAFSDKLERFASSADPAGYDTSLFLSKKGTRSAFQCLIDAMHCLGAATEKLSPEEPRDPRLLCAGLLALYARASCWTMYTWKEGAFGPGLIGSAGLRYPEALVGSALTGGVVRPSMLIPLGNQELCRVVPVPSSPTESSSFVSREGILRCWSIGMRTPHDCLILFLNWRGEPSADAILEAKHLKELNWRDQGHPISDTAHAAEECRLPWAREPKDLHPLIRYCRGWLAGEAAADRRAGAGRVNVPPRALPRRLVELFTSWLEQDDAESAPPVFGKNIHVNGILHQVLDGVPYAVAESVAYDAVKRELKFPNRKALRDWTGKSLPHDPLILKPEARGLVQEGGSLVGQSIAWQASILLEMVPATPPGDPSGGGEPPPPDSLLRRRLWGRPNHPTRSELVVPVFAGKTPIGGIVVEAADPGTLKAAHLPTIEAISLCVGSLTQLCTERAWKSERDWVHSHFIKVGSSVPIDEPALWKVLADWALQRAGADVAFVAVPSPSGPRNLVRAVSVAPRVPAAFREHSRALTDQVSSQFAGADRGIFSRSLGEVEVALHTLLDIPPDVQRRLLSSQSPWMWADAAELPGLLGCPPFRGLAAVAVKPNEALAPLAVLGLASVGPRDRTPALTDRPEWPAEGESIGIVGQVISSLSIAYSVSTGEDAGAGR